VVSSLVVVLGGDVALLRVRACDLYVFVRCVRCLLGGDAAWAVLCPGAPGAGLFSLFCRLGVVSSLVVVLDGGVALLLVGAGVLYVILVQFVTLSS
jgi:hypothetical protein